MLTKDLYCFRERYEEIGKKIKREADDYSQMGKRYLLGNPGTTTTLNTVTPCAACKLLRRRCAQECPFSPYFSPHEPQKFASVHKVFGASNVSKMLMVSTLIKYSPLLFFSLLEQSWILNSMTILIILKFKLLERIHFATGLD